MERKRNTWSRCPPQGGQKERPTYCTCQSGDAAVVNTARKVKKSLMGAETVEDIVPEKPNNPSTRKHAPNVGKVQQERWII